MILQPLLAPEANPGGPRPSQVPFQEHVDLLLLFLTRRAAIVEGIQGLLNAQRKPLDYLQDGARLARYVEDCFFALSGVTQDRYRLRGQLEAAHRASGFTPREIPGLHNGLPDPAEMMVRAFFLWRQTRWPGRNGRVRFAHTLFNLFLVRCLELLSMRAWDAGAERAGDRLSQVQDVLDRLWQSTPADQPVLVRDARWLIQLAQSPATDDLSAYFAVAEQTAGAFSDDDRLALHMAGARMTAGHLRSQIRYYSTKNGVPLDEPGLVRRTRTSNALDFALLIQDLVPLLEVYERAVHAGDRERRLALADAVCQAVSPDPELFLIRVELLGPYSMVEHLFIAANPDGQVTYTPMGQRHVRLIETYAALVGRVARALFEDCPNFRPIAGTYSPYGLLYGFSSDLLEHMVFRTLQPGEVSGFSLEDVFVGGAEDKLAWVNGWRKLPHLTPEVATLFDYPQQFAEDIFDRVQRALAERVAADDETGTRARTGRLFAVTGDASHEDSAASLTPDLPSRYIASSDRQLVAAHKAEAGDETQILSDRREGRCVLSYQTPGGWVAVTKAILTDVLGAGRDAKVTGLSPSAADTLKLMCRDLVVRPERQAQPASAAAATPLDG